MTKLGTGYVNGEEVGSHVGGHQPFEIDVTDKILLGQENKLSRQPEGAFKDVGNFDFFNYAGILRSVHLMILPSSHIQEIGIVAEHRGSFSYEILTSHNSSGEDVNVHVYDPDGKEVFSSRGLEGKGSVDKVRPWWPRGMGNSDMYSMKVELVRISDQSILDVFHQSFGFRTVSWTDRQLLINEKCRKQGDSPISFEPSPV